jgi:hypothetical protein
MHFKKRAIKLGAKCTEAQNLGVLDLQDQFTAYQVRGGKCE